MILFAGLNHRSFPAGTPLVGQASNF